MASKSISTWGITTDLSTAKEDRIIVDKKLLDSFFRDYKPASLDKLKETLKLLIDNSETIDQMNNAVTEHLYVTDIATQFHNIPPPPEIA